MSQDRYLISKMISTNETGDKSNSRRLNNILSHSKGFKKTCRPKASIQIIESSFIRIYSLITGVFDTGEELKTGICSKNECRRLFWIKLYFNLTLQIFLIYSF